RLPHSHEAAARPDYFRGSHHSSRASRRVRPRVHHCLLERGQPYPRTHGSPRGGIDHPRRTRRRDQRLAADPTGRRPRSLYRRLRVFAVVQIAASFMLLAGASMLLKTLISLQTAQTGLDMQHVLAINVPVMKYDKTPQQVVDFYKDSIRHIDELPGVIKTAYG